MNNTANGEWWSKQSEEILRKQYPLHCSVRDGDVEAMLSLLKTGAYDLYEEDDFYGWTPTHWAAYFGKLTCLMHLLEYGANCDNSTHRVSQTPAHIAALAGHSHCLKWLLHCGAGINRQDYLGETPVHKAARMGSMECVSLLISQGASLCIKNHNGQVPSMVAAVCGFQECSNYIEKAMQLQQQNLVLQTKTCPNENNNTRMPGFDESPCNGQLNGHSYDINNGHTETNDMEMEMDSTDACSDSLSKVVYPHVNGFAANGGGDVHEKQALSNGFSHMKCFSGAKRGRDDCEDECFKRRRVHDKLHMCREESSNNNNVLSSYNAILAISAHPLPCSALDSLAPSSGNLSSVDGAPVENANFHMLSSMVSHHIPLYKSPASVEPSTEQDGLSYHEAPAKCTLLSSHIV